MQIHRVKSGESVYSIAGEYGVSPAKIIEINGLKNPDRLAIGRELLILFPTRTYTARRGDTLESISKRFSVSRSELMKNNPQLLGKDKIYAEEVFVLKYPEKNHGIALLNGYLYKGCPTERLALALPYLSHLTLSSFVYEKGRLRGLFDTGEAVAAAKELKKSILLRIYCRPPYSDGDFDNEFIRQATKAAKDCGCDGIVLSADMAVKDDKLADFLFEMKKAAISEGLTLSLECDGEIAERCADTADSVIISFDDCIRKDGTDSEKTYTAFADSHDASKAFIDLSPFAYRNGEPVPIDTALSYIDRSGGEGELSEDGRLLRFSARGEEIILPSLENIKTKLDLIGELGYLGCAVDIMRCPVSHLMMLSSLFHLSPDYFSGGI